MRWKRGRFRPVVQNLGQKLKFAQEEYSQPLTVAAGINFRLGEGLSLGMDVRRMVYEEQTSLSVGTEYWLMGRVALRGGYLSQASGTFPSAGRSEAAASRLGPLSGLNMGLGLRIAGYQMDYALSPSAEFGNTHRLSLSLKF